MGAELAGFLEKEDAEVVVAGGVGKLLEADGGGEAGRACERGSGMLERGREESERGWESYLRRRCRRLLGHFHALLWPGRRTRPAWPSIAGLWTKITSAVVFCLLQRIAAVLCFCLGRSSIVFSRLGIVSSQMVLRSGQQDALISLRAST